MIAALDTRFFAEPLRIRVIVEARKMGIATVGGIYIPFTLCDLLMIGLYRINAYSHPLFPDLQWLTFLQVLKKELLAYNKSTYTKLIWRIEYENKRVTRRIFDNTPLKGSTDAIH